MQKTTSPKKNRTYRWVRRFQKRIVPTDGPKKNHAYRCVRDSLVERVFVRSTEWSLGRTPVRPASIVARARARGIAQSAGIAILALCVTVGVGQLTRSGLLGLVVGAAIVWRQT